MSAFHREPANEEQTRADAQSADALNMRYMSAFDQLQAPENVKAFEDWNALVPSFLAPTNETRNDA